MAEIPQEEEGRDSLVEIDEFNLDKEWYLQPKLVRRFGFKMADVKLKVAERKAALDLVKADLELRIRENPVDYGLKKVSEAGVKATIIVQEEYQTAQRIYHKAQHKLDQYESLMRALEHRKKALESAVALHGQGYFAEPREPKGVTTISESNKRRVRSVGRKKRKAHG